MKFYKGEPAMEKAFFLNSTNPDYMKYFRSYKRLLLESILILSQGSPTVSSDVEAILEFETSFAKVCAKSRMLFFVSLISVSKSSSLPSLSRNPVRKKHNYVLKEDSPKVCVLLYMVFV
jgi:hypothetical protein